MTTRVYVYSPPEGTPLVVPEDDSTATDEVLSFREKRPVSTTWRPVPVKVLWEYPRGSKRREDADFLYPNFGTLTMGRRAKTLLSVFLSPFGELLPLECDAKELFVLNVTNTIDAIDLDRSQILDRVNMDPEHPAISRAAFIEDAVNGQVIFRVRERSLSDIYFTDRFWDEVRRHNLTGFGYRLEWESHRDDP